MRHFRGSRGMGRRRMVAPIQSYKKVLHFAEASFSAGLANELLIDGKDSVAAGQTSATDAAVPTGSIIKWIEIHFAVSNVVLTPCFINCTIQYSLSGQGVVDPDLCGGDARRNQVLHMDLFTVGEGQNSTHKFRFKVLSNSRGYEKVWHGN